MANTVAKYQEYAEYKDSGVEWLGEIPSHWEIKKLVWFFSAEKGKNGQLLTKEYCGLNAGDFPVYSGQTENNGIMGRINFYEFDVGNNGVLFSTTVGAKAMTLSFLQGKFSLSQNCMIIKPRKNNIITRFYYYHCQPLFAKERGLIPEHMQASFRVEDLYSYRISLPPITEQTQITNFLDHETAKIDTLIAKQEKLIELLKEKRQAVISHAVTKGLNPNVTLKDSGVEWLGQVPEHWKCIKLKHITTTFEQGWSPQCDTRPAESNEYGVLKVGCVNGGSFRSSENKALPPELEPRLQYLIQKDDLLISRANTKELVGSASVVDGDYPNLILCDKLYRLRFSKNLLPEMVSLYLSIGVVREQIELGATGASHSMQNIGQDTIKELYYLLPPCEEALKILESIKQSNQNFDELTKKAESAIQLMQERRTALISSAVTGKIDVRNWQKPNKNNDAKTEFGA